MPLTPKRKRSKQILREKNNDGVKFFHDGKGYGFIKPDNGEKDIFVHVSQLDNIGGYLEDGQVLLFNTQEGRKGLEATNIGKVESTAYKPSDMTEQ